LKNSKNTGKSSVSRIYIYVCARARMYLYAFFFFGEGGGGQVQVTRVLTLCDVTFIDRVFLTN